MRRTYIALLHKEPDSDYGISFHDFPGCVTAAATVEEVTAQAHEALALHIAGMVEDGETIPEATDLDKILGIAEGEGLVGYSLIEAVLPSRAKRINITLEEGLIDEIDRASNNRSGFLAEAARAELQRRRAG